MVKKSEEKVWATSTKWWHKLTERRAPKATYQELTVFTRQFATLLGAGVAIVAAFDSFTDRDNGVHCAIEQVGKKVEAGYRLSQAMRGLPKVFDTIYCGLVESGEKTGQLVDVLLKLADDLEKQLKTRKRLVAALTYPAVLMVAAITCVLFFLITVLPMLEPMFTQMHVQLPMPTQILLNLRYIVPASLVGLVVFGLVGFFVYKRMTRFPLVLRKFHRLVLVIPLFGPLYRALTITRILQSLSTMLEMGVAMVQAFKACESLTTNTHIEHQIGEIRRLIMDGETMTEALQKEKLFPRSVIQLVAAGEESSDMVGMFQFAARILQEDTDIAIEQMAMNLEPIIMIFMGLVVGFIVLAAMLPIVQLLQNI